jgi:membrane protein
VVERRRKPRPFGLISRLKRTWRLGWRAAGRGVIEFYRSSNLTFAASIAYYSLLSMFPFVLLVLSILNRWSPVKENSTLLEIIAQSLPPHFDFVSLQIQQLAQTPLRLSVAGTIIMAWASMGVFGAITSAVNHAWGVERPIGFFKHKLVAFVMMLAAGTLLLGTLFLMSAVQFAEARWFSGVIAYFPAFENFRGFAIRNAPTPMFIFVVGLIYYYAPNAQVRLRDVWFGAILAGLLWRLLFSGFSWYIRDLSRFAIHGQITAVVLFLVWIYMSAVVFLYGVEVTAAYARARKNLPQAAPAAPVREE